MAKWIVEEITLRGRTFPVLSVETLTPNGVFVVATWWRVPGCWLPTPIAFLGGLAGRLDLSGVPDPYSLPFGPPFNIGRKSAPCSLEEVNECILKAYEVITKSSDLGRREGGFDG